MSLISLAFNEWMRRYVDEPARFERELDTVFNFIVEEDEGQEPSYGSACEAYLNQIMREINESK